MFNKIRHGRTLTSRSPSDYLPKKVTALSLFFHKFIHYKLTIKYGAKIKVYHDRRVSDAHNPQRIFDTLWMLVRSDLFVYTPDYQHSRVAPWCDRAGGRIRLQSLQLSIANEQNLCNLAHWVDCQALPPPSRKRQGGVTQMQQAHRASILALTNRLRRWLIGICDAVGWRVREHICYHDRASPKLVVLGGLRSSR